MVNILISIVFACISFTIFGFNYDINGLNRLLFSTPSELFETSIDLINATQNEAYFKKEELLSKLDNYYLPKIKDYTETYNLNYRFYNPLDNSYCIGDKCNAIDISLNAKLKFNVNYSKTIYYEIRRGLHV